MINNSFYSENFIFFSFDDESIIFMTMRRGILLTISTKFDVKLKWRVHAAMKESPSQGNAAFFLSSLSLLLLFSLAFRWWSEDHRSERASGFNLQCKLYYIVVDKRLPLGYLLTVVEILFDKTNYPERWTHNTVL